jgi:hypothetical protein
MRPPLQEPEDYSTSTRLFFIRQNHEKSWRLLTSGHAVFSNGLIHDLVPRVASALSFE